ncbi:MAG TPA: N-acetylmuramoyl-L-alanine amidase [Verrucomicrobiae bacterium]|nr:N-acetylmuramoyl-L-alanine amidase [Verrucomicrobiae bacterium]
MKFALQFFVLAGALTFSPAAILGAESSFTRVHVAGKEYVQLGDWARANHFVPHWLNDKKSIQYVHGSKRLVFNLDPRLDRTKAQINGVEVTLSFPIQYEKGIAYISQLDLTKTIRPVLSPPKNARGIKIKSVCLDPGHGGKDPGNRVGSNEEQKYTLLLARDVRDYLENAGLRVTLTRDKDVYVPLDTRPELARKRKADLFVSLHFNSTASSRSRVKGAETYCLTPAGAYSSNSGGKGNTHWVKGNGNDSRNMLLAYEIQKALVTKLDVEDRGIKRARYAVLREAAMPAVLVEGGFMSHPTEGKKIFSAAYRKKMARAIADAILDYKKDVDG